MTKQNNGRCKYCLDRLIDQANIRCDHCDKAWQDGFREGQQQLTEKLRETVTHLLKFVGIFK